MEAFRNLIMSQQGNRKTKRLLDFQARNQLGTPGSEEFSKKGTHYVCEIVSKYVQQIFPVGGNFSWEASPLGYRPVDVYASQKTNVFLRTSCAFSILV